MASEWANDMDMSELRELCDHMWLIEEIPMARIQDLCGAHVIDSYKFNSLWLKLLDESHAVVARAEERMEAIPSE